MALSQSHIPPSTAMGANLVDGGGATFRVWAPHATALYVVGDFNGWTHGEDSLLIGDGNGYWTRAPA